MTSRKWALSLPVRRLELLIASPWRPRMWHSARAKRTLAAAFASLQDDHFALLSRKLNEGRADQSSRNS